MKYLFLILIPLFCHILYTDVKWRKVNLLIILSALALSVGRLFYSLPISLALTTITLNLLLLTLLLIVLFTYTRIRKIRFQEALAFGDILFLGVVLFTLSPISFLFFIILSSLIGFVYYIILKMLKQKESTIPYAGLMAAMLIPIVAYDVFSIKTFYDETYLVQLILQ